MLANGLKYGGSIELRQNQGFAAELQPESATRARCTCSASFVYVGADKFGKVSLGSPVQPTELFQTGNPANFNTGGWDGDLPGIFTTGLDYFLTDTNDRANKIVYVSPQFTGFDFGLSFEPNDYGNEYGKPFTRASSVGGDDTLDPATGVVTNSALQFGKRRNTVDGAARYQGTFGAIGIKADVGGSYGGSVRSSGTVQADGSTINGPNVKNFTLVTGGISATFAGLELDGLIDHGQFGPSLVSVQTGQTTAYIVGASYTMGPMIFGASYYGFDSGFTRAVGAGNMHGYGIAAGGTYTLAPGASLFLEYLYGHMHSNGVRLRGRRRRQRQCSWRQQQHPRPGLRHRHRLQVVG